MKIKTLAGVVLACVLPAIAEAQHSHGGGGRDQVPRAKSSAEAPAAKRPSGMLPEGSPRQIEVLVLDYGFSPSEIRADVGETVTLLVRRSDLACVDGLGIPSRKVNFELPIGETVAITLELKQAERLEIKCRNEAATATIVVGSP